VEYLACNQQVITARGNGMIDAFDLRSRCYAESFNMTARTARVTALKIVKKAGVLAAAGEAQISVLEY
jgi:hypothetical protein